jgi:hypothetical protein
MKPLSQAFKAAVIQKLINGDSSRIISHAMSISHTTVNRIRRTYQPDIFRLRGGRPTLLGARTRRQLTRFITTGRADNAKQLLHLSGIQQEHHITTQTIRNALKKEGLRSAVKKRKPYLKQVHIKARLDFAHKYLDWTIEDWSRVVFSDETKINRLGSDGRCWTWRRPGKQLSMSDVRGTLKFGGGSIMFWGCMSVHGPGFGCRIDGKLNTDLYVQILGGEMLDSIQLFGFDTDAFVFQQDNDPKHTSRAAREWFISNKINVLDWPAQSPDLNPIEHLWAHLKRQLADYDEAPVSMNDLWLRVEAEWDKIKKETCADLIHSMPKRVAAVLKAKGKYTKY